MAAAVCPMCQASDFAELNGVLVCNVCGTQTQTFIEETEFQQGINDARFVRAIRTAKPVAPATNLEEEERQAQARAEDVSLLYCQCLQKLVQDQAQALSTQLGVNEQVATVMRQLWVSHIAITGILEPDYHNRRPGQPKPGQAHAGRSGGDDSGSEGGSDSPGSGDDDHMKSEEEEQQERDEEEEQQTAVITNAYKLHTVLWRVLPPRDTLVIAFLACLHLREPVTPMDIVRWALDGALPFLDLPSRSKALLAARPDVPLPARTLQPSLSDPPLAFLRRAVGMAASLGLPLALVNGLPLLDRAMHDLQLPRAVGTVAAELHRMHQLGTPLMSIHPSDQPPARAHPYATLMATIIVALKLLYGLDGGRPMRRVAAAMLPPVDWQVWAAALARRLPVISGFPLTKSQVLGLSGDLRRAYLHHCQHNVFDGFKPPRELQDFQRMLLGFLTEDRLAAAHPYPGMAATLELPQQPTRAAGSTADAAEDMDDDQYSLANASDRATPDYAAVLCACAMYAHVTPIRLNMLVRHLEQQMLLVESAVSVAMQKAQPLQNDVL